MDKLKGWLVDVLLKKFGPSAIRGAILGLGGFLAAKEGVLSAFGIVYDKTSHILAINLDTLSLLGVAAIPALGAGLIKIINHEGNAIVKTVVTPTTESK